MHIQRETMQMVPKSFIPKPLVMDNLNAHVLGALCEAFLAEKARELVKRIEVH